MLTFKRAIKVSDARYDDRKRLKLPSIPRSRWQCINSTPLNLLSPIIFNIFEPQKLSYQIVYRTSY